MLRSYRLLKTLLADAPGASRRLWLATFLAACASGASVALMGLSAWLISRAAEMPPVLYLQAAAVGVRAFGISRGVFRYVERLVGHDVALRLQSALRLNTYDALSQTTLIGRRRGDLLSRVVSDVSAVQDLVVRVAIPVLSASLVIVGTTVMLARFSLSSALVLFVTAVLAGVVLPMVAQRASLAADRRAAAARGQLADGTRELARTARDLVAYGAEDASLTRLLRSDDELCRIEARGAWVRGLATGGQVLAAGIAVLAALLIGAPAVASGELKPRLLAVLVLTPLAMHEVLATFTQAAQTYTRARAALGRVEEIVSAPPVGTGDVPPGEETPGLHFVDATVGWPGNIPVQSGITLSIKAGQRVALTGPSGVGKTTMAATALGLIPPLAGSVSRGGRVGYLAQDAHIFATSVAENVRIGDKEASDEQVLAALQRAGLDLDPYRVLSEAGGGLSGGERRRLALARVLVAERDLLILDEPTEHLDQEVAAALMRDIWAASRDQAVLVITHDPAVMTACDRIESLHSQER